MEPAEAMRLVADYLCWVSGFQGQHIYRGHSKTGWELIPSVARPNIEGINSTTRLNEWVTTAAPFSGRQPSGEIEWLVLAQHHGVATPLLDWTTNPLVAMHFACDVQDHDGEILALPLSDLKRFDDDEWGDAFSNPSEPVQWLRIASMNARATAQRGVSTLHRPVNAPVPRLKVRSYTLPADKKKNAMQALEVLGIDEPSLMGDLATAAKALLRKWRE